jgi:4-carboxymuconolactone decarboxylase
MEPECSTGWLRGKYRGALPRSGRTPTRYTGTACNVSMTHSPEPGLSSPLDAATRTLVRLAALAAGGTEVDLRAALAGAPSVVPTEWVEELILQTYLFAGFPRALNAAREWRRISGAAALDAEGTTYARVDDWRVRGESTCAIVYGPAYSRLRENIRALHPALDTWMIVEGYGKVLSRPGLDLARRELCVVAACAIMRQDRQLHSHLHGAVHAGASPDAVDDTLSAIADLVGDEGARSARMLWMRVRAQHG